MELPLTLENAIYSEQGRWGVLVPHEMHALVGGPPEFLTAVDDGYGRDRDDLHLFRDAWVNDANAGWLDQIASHIGL